MGESRGPTRGPTRTSHIPPNRITPGARTPSQFLCYKKLKKVLKSLPAIDTVEQNALEPASTSGTQPAIPQRKAG